MPATIPSSVKVSYRQQYRRCGKPGCPSCRPGAPGHGPYWYAAWWADGRMHSRYIGKELPDGRTAAPDAQAGPVEAPAAPAPAPRVEEAPPSAPTQPEELRAAGALRVRTLGDFAVWRGTSAIPAEVWTRRKVVAALFKQLLSAEGCRLPREHLMESLWPDAEPATAAGNLRYTVHLLRRVLDGPDAARSHLRWDGELLTVLPAHEGEPPEDWLDAAAFERAARRALAGRDAEACAAALQRYHGEYLPDDPYSEWAETRRVSLRRQYLALLLHLAELREEQGALGEATRCLRAVLAADPCHETAARALMRVQTTAGQHVEAIRTYQQLAEALQRDLDLAPDGETQALYEQVLERRQAAARRHTNLPTPLTSFLGRKRELATLLRLLTGGQAPTGDAAAEPERSTSAPRLVTVTGSGGSGKTRLAIEVGHALRSHYPDGLWLVELAALPAESQADPLLIAQQIGAALGLRQQPGQSPPEGLSAYLGPRHALLILDNCEHVLASCVALLAPLLAACPSVQVLATSRQALGVLGETVWRLPSLTVPPEGAEADLPLPDLARYAAVRLLVERARAVKPGFALTLDNRRALAAICRQLDGIPLAIELAAARLSVLSPDDLAARLTDRFRLLAGGNRAALPRHQTLRAVMEWSYALLSAPEQALLRALSVFAGNWTLDAAEGICTIAATDDADILDLLARLVGKSLVQVEDGEEAAGEQTRYRLLETVRQYAAGQLKEASEEAQARNRHLSWYLTMAEQAKPGLDGPEQAAWLERLERAHDNLRAALRWSIAEDGDRALGLRLARSLASFWEKRGYFNEGRSWLERVLAQQPAVDDAVRAAALSRAGNLAYAQGDHARAKTLYEEALVMRRALGHPAPLALAILNVGNVAFAQGDHARARALYEEALAIQEQVGDLSGRARTLNNLGVLARSAGDHARALALFEESSRLWRTLGDAWHLTVALTNLGNAANSLGRPERAQSLYRESLIMRRDLGDRQGTMFTLISLSHLALTRGDPERAARLAAAAMALGARIGAPPPAHGPVTYEQFVAETRRALGEDRFAALWAEGQAMDQQRAIEYALGD